MTVDLLAIGPHPDDLELCCGGWLALAAAAGHRVVMVDLTAGEMATHGTVEIRAAEAAEAARALGASARHNLGLPDARVDDRDPAQRDAVVGLLRALKPRLVLAPWLEARHPDHAAAGRLVRDAVFFAGLAKHRPDLGPPHRPARRVAYPMRHEARPDFVVDITAVLAQKRAAIACHASQFGHHDTLVGAPLGLDAFAVRDRYWGASIGVMAGEPYVLDGPVPLADPIAALADGPSPVLVPPR